MRAVSLVYLCCLCAAGIGGGSRGPGIISGAGGLPGASVVAAGAVLLLLLSLVSGCSLMLLFGCTQSCLVPCVLICLFPPHAGGVLGVSCRRRLFGALFVCSRSRVVGPRSWAGSPSWSVPFGVSCCCLRCYTCSPYCVCNIGRRHRPLIQSHVSLDTRQPVSFKVLLDVYRHGLQHQNVHPS